MFWRTYDYGFKSKDAAQSTLWDEVSEGRLTESDCRVAFYRTTEGKPRWQIQELCAA